LRQLEVNVQPLQLKVVVIRPNVKTGSVTICPVPQV
jgi:hypothetical protein